MQLLNNSADLVNVNSCIILGLHNCNAAYDGKNKRVINPTGSVAKTTLIKILFHNMIKLCKIVNSHIQFKMKTVFRR